MPKIPTRIGQIIKLRQRPPMEEERHLGNMIDAGGRRVKVERFDHNMPKHQSCPTCGKSVKRTRKTVGGAHYYCNKCKNGSFVRAKER